MSDFENFQDHCRGELESISNVEITFVNVTEGGWFNVSFRHCGKLYLDVPCDHLFMRGDTLYLIPKTSTEANPIIFETQHLLSSQNPGLIEQLNCPNDVKSRLKNMIEHKLY